ncbi:MAG: aminoacyl-histidine dipeptidase [Holophaga sp.]|nr:aminoacyl-histidine dipeptidase [Holophaga sp.]
MKPKEVFHFFEELTRIPRGSGNEKQASDYLVDFARQRKLAVFQDEALNVIIKKPGTAGYEHSPAVIIQGHMDMVCEKAEGCRHDFTKDPLVLKIEGDILRAVGTTLGADDGIAVAFGLAVLDSADLPHPPLELVVTTSEETGMDGAHALDPAHLTGKTMLNIDAEQEGVLIVSCAGGMNLVCAFDTSWRKTVSGGLTIKVSGLKGGHSGLEIIQQRANAIKLLGRILDAARAAGEFGIAAISGGSKANAIAREAQATLTGRAPVLAKIKLIAQRLAKDLKTECALVDPGLKVGFAAVAKVARRLDQARTDKLIAFLVAVPNGVQSMSRELEGLVESSLNLGVLEQPGPAIRLTVSIRSCVDSIRDDLVRRVETLAGLVGAQGARSGAYPAWRYQPESAIRDRCLAVYQKVAGHAPEIRAIHAGLECGLLKEKLPQTDMISFGPNLYGVHTHDEHLSIGSVARTWAFLVSVLAQCK